MKRKPFLIFVVIAMIFVSVGIFINRGVRAVNVSINVKDLPEYGLHIIGPSDPSFDSMLAKATKDEPASVVELIKPFTFFLSNTGSKHVIAYKFRWECTKPDGAVIYKDSSTSSAWIFTDDVGDLNKALNKSQDIIKPNSTWLFSLGLAPRQLDNSPSRPEQSGVWATISNRTDSQENMGVPDQNQALKLLHNELAAYTSITIVLDGVFFADGSFAGPDATGFFDAVKSEVDAKLDILNGFQEGIRKGKPSDEIFKEITDISDEPDVDLGPDSTASDYYRFHRKIFAQELLSQQQSSGSEQTIKHALKRLEKPWVKLRKQ